MCRTFRLPITDSLAGQVIRTGEATLMDEGTPQKIKTSYLVQSLLYVPLSMHGHVMGVLGVDNRHSHLPLTQRHVTLLNALSSYAVIALENARMYSETATERNKLEDDPDGHPGRRAMCGRPGPAPAAWSTRAARGIFGIAADVPLDGKPFQDIFIQEEMLQLASSPEDWPDYRVEMSPMKIASSAPRRHPSEDVGRVFTLHDITYLKKLDHIKTDFVHTVSHDLRSPLTAILGYVELVERAGPVTDLSVILFAAFRFRCTILPISSMTCWILAGWNWALMCAKRLSIWIRLCIIPLKG